jgi:hypothetical protein
MRRVVACAVVVASLVSATPSRVRADDVDRCIAELDDAEV